MDGCKGESWLHIVFVDHTLARDDILRTQGSMFFPGIRKAINRTLAGTLEGLSEDSALYKRSPRPGNALTKVHAIYSTELL